MTKNENILTSYCFLAALTENQNDLFNHVFVPICKRALSLYSLQGSTHGKASDIKALILQQYGIDIPILMVKKLINAAFKSLSKRDRNKYNFNVLENGNSFQIQLYSFSDLEIEYKKGQRNAKALQLAFLEYLKSEGLETSGIPTYAEFLERNKKLLSSFFKSTAAINNGDVESSFVYHVNFLEQIETSNHKLFEISKGLYIGTIVASFLEAGLDLEPKFDSVVEFYLDTPIILKALDLQKEEDKEPMDELLELIRRTGGKLKVLSITIDEIQRILETSINMYNSGTPTTTINEACIRLGKNKAWLIGFNGRLESNLLTMLKAEKVIISDEFKEKHKKSVDVKALEDERSKKGNALHDVLAYLYVREKRGGHISSFQKASKWFLTSNIDLLKFNINHSPNQGGVSEIILPEALTSLLWLKDPVKLVSKVKTIGLSELMATTLSEEIASKELLNEFESSIRKLEGISDEDYRILLESVAHQSAMRIDHFNEIANSNIVQAKIEANKILEQERTRRARIKKQVKDAQTAKNEQEEKNKQLIESLARIEGELAKTKSEASSSKTLIEELSEKLNSQTVMIKRYGWRLILGVVFLILSGLIIVFRNKLDDFFWILNVLSGSGWLWSFGSFLINVYKIKKAS